MSENTGFLFTIEGQAAMVPLVELLALIGIAASSAAQVTIDMVTIQGLINDPSLAATVPEGLVQRTADHYVKLGHTLDHVWGPFMDEAVKHTRQNGI